MTASAVGGTAVDVKSVFVAKIETFNYLITSTQEKLNKISIYGLPKRPLRGSNYSWQVSQNPPQYNGGSDESYRGRMLDIATKPSRWRCVESRKAIERSDRYKEEEHGIVMPRGGKVAVESGMQGALRATTRTVETCQTPEQTLRHRTGGRVMKPVIYSNGDRGNECHSRHYGASFQRVLHCQKSKANGRVMSPRTMEMISTHCIYSDMRLAPR